MNLASPISFHATSGRVIGSYVYLILCRDNADIHIKIGMSIDPMKRLFTLSKDCEFEPEVLAYTAVPSTAIARSLECDLHVAFRSWRTSGEWFRFVQDDKSRFNAICNSVLAAYSKPSMRLTWTKANAQCVLKELRQNKAERFRQYKGHGHVYRDSSLPDPAS